MNPAPPDNCPRCNTAWKTHTFFVSQREHYTVVCKKCQLGYLDGDYELYVNGWFDGKLDEIKWVDIGDGEYGTSGVGAPYNYHNQGSGEVIFDFDFWLPFDITEDRLSKLLLLR